VTYPRMQEREILKSVMVLRQRKTNPAGDLHLHRDGAKANQRVSVMCRALKVSKGGFYAWRDRAPSARARADTSLLEKIVRIHTHSREIYGAPRIHFELRVLGVRCARKHVARLMREASLFGCGGR
jgi:putative transposase